MFSKTLSTLAKAKRAVRVFKRRPATPYIAFLKVTKADPALMKCKNLKQRSKLASAMWKKMPSSEKAAYVTKAKSITLKPRVKKARKPSGYALFVKKHYKSVKTLPFLKRLPALGKMWKAAQKK